VTEDPILTTTVLFVCTANICRSRMAEAVMADRAESLCLPIRVRSAGTLDGGRDVPPEVFTVLQEAGVGSETLERPSRSLIVADLEHADLVLGLAREHVRAAAVLLPDAWLRTFTLKELLRRGSEIGPRSTGEPVVHWVERLHLGREAADLLGESREDDVADPIGQPLRRYRETRLEIESLVQALIDLAWAPEVRGRQPQAELGD
jgi:protein-tyrosine phosphatase